MVSFNRKKSGKIKRRTLFDTKYIIRLCTACLYTNLQNVKNAKVLLRHMKVSQNVWRLTWIMHKHKKIMRHMTTYIRKFLYKIRLEEMIARWFLSDTCSQLWIIVRRNWYKRCAHELNCRFSYMRNVGGVEKEKNIRVNLTEWRDLKGRIDIRLQIR